VLSDWVGHDALPLWIVGRIAVRLRAKAAISQAVSRGDLAHAVAIDQSDKVIGRIVANGALNEYPRFRLSSPMRIALAAVVETATGRLHFGGGFGSRAGRLSR